MWRFNAQMVGMSEACGGLLGLLAPQDQRARSVVKQPQTCCCDDLPSDIFMSVCCLWRHCQDRIQQQDTLFCPRSEVPTRGGYAGVLVQFLENIGQRPRKRPGLWRDRKREAMGMSGCGVGILTQDYDRHSGWFAKLKSRENLLSGRQVVCG